MNLLLLSNSTNFGESYMEWCKDTMAEFLKGAGARVVFIPYAAASFSFDEYTRNVNTALADHQIEVQNIANFENKLEAISQATAILVGGGNTFHLLHHLQQDGLVEAIRSKVAEGTPYVGWSAGSNVAGPSIRTTNDMPIIEPASFESFALIPHQINPHYTEETLPNHGGESRFQRLTEFIAVNPGSKVICLPEAAYLIQQGRELRYEGKENGKMISRIEVADILPGSVIAVS